MTRGLYRATTGLLLVALAQAPARAENTAARVVQYSNDALTVRLTNAPVDEVLGEIGHQAGAEIRGQVAGTREVSADFDAVPLAEALHRLLGNQNFALVYGDKGNLKAVKLLGEAQTSTVVRQEPPPTTPSALTEEATRVLGYMNRPIPLPAGSSLVRVFGTPTAPFRRLLETGLSSEDATVRADTVRAALQAIEAEPQFRVAVAQAVGSTDDASLGELLRGVAGEHAEEIARLVVAQTKMVQLRNKATMFLGKPGQ